MFLSLYQVNVDFLIYKSNEQRFIIQQIFDYPIKLSLHNH